MLVFLLLRHYCWVASLEGSQTLGWGVFGVVYGVVYGVVFGVVLGEC